MRGGWWRRNWWAVAALPPILVAVVVLNPGDGVSRWWDAQAGAVAVDEAGWATLDGVGVRVLTVAPADLRTPDDESFSLAAGLVAWQVRVAVAQPAEAVFTCEIELEDDAGRRFGDRPMETRDARLGAQGPTLTSFGCLPPDGSGDSGDAGELRYEMDGVFVLPESARPVAVWVSTTWSEKPRYARFPVSTD